MKVHEQSVEVTDTNYIVDIILNPRVRNSFTVLAQPSDIEKKGNKKFIIFYWVICVHSINSSITVSLKLLLYLTFIVIVSFENTIR